jgi:hypothetical protein
MEICLNKLTQKLFKHYYLYLTTHFQMTVVTIWKKGQIFLIQYYIIVIQLTINFGFTFPQFFT